MVKPGEDCYRDTYQTYAQRRANGLVPSSPPSPVTGGDLLCAEVT